MKRKDKEQCRHDIAEAFDFARFLVRNPRALRKVKGGSEIRLLRVPQRGPRQP